MGASSPLADRTASRTRARVWTRRLSSGLGILAVVALGVTIWVEWPAPPMTRTWPGGGRRVRIIFHPGHSSFPMRIAEPFAAGAAGGRVASGLGGWADTGADAMLLLPLLASFARNGILSWSPTAVALAMFAQFVLTSLRFASRSGAAPLYHAVGRAFGALLCCAV